MATYTHAIHGQLPAATPVSGFRAWMLAYGQYPTPEVQ